MKYTSQLTLLAVLLASVLISPAHTKAAANSLGTNVIDNGTVYTITKENNKTVRRPYTSAGAYLSYSFNSWENLVAANSDDLALAVGTFIPPRDGSIICSDRGYDQGTCYLITDQTKAGFTNENAFFQYGFTYQWALYGDISFLQSTDHIESGSEKHRPGMIINWNGKDYLVTNAGLREVASRSVLESWGYWDGDIISANSSDWQYAITDKLPARGDDEIHPDLGDKVDPEDDPLEIITSGTLPDAIAGQDYSKQLKASGGAEPYRWSLVETDYPSSCCVLGLSAPPGGESDYYGLHEPVYFNTQSGDTVPYTYIGTYHWTYKVTDANGDTVTKKFTLTIK